MKTVALVLLLAGLTTVAFAGGQAPEVNTSYVPGVLVVLGGAVLVVRAKLRK